MAEDLVLITCLHTPHRVSQEVPSTCLNTSPRSYSIPSAGSRPHQPEPKLLNQPLPRAFLIPTDRLSPIQLPLTLFSMLQLFSLAEKQ